MNNRIEKIVGNTIFKYVLFISAVDSYLSLLYKVNYKITEPDIFYSGKIETGIKYLVIDSLNYSRIS